MMTKKHYNLPKSSWGKVVTNGMVSKETAMIVWHIAKRPSFRRPPKSFSGMKSHEPKRYPTNNEDETVLAALTLNMEDMVWWSTPTCLYKIDIKRIFHFSNYLTEKKIF